MKEKYLRLKPMIPTLGELADLSKNNFLFEPKLDGYRALCFKNRKATFISRTGMDFTAQFPELKSIKVRARECVLDGEIIAFDERGNPSFNKLQNKATPIVFVAFDILMKNNVDLTSLPLHERKYILEKTLIDGPNAQKMVFTTNSERLLELIKLRGIEGIVAKDLDSKYELGKSKKWIKIKSIKSIDCIIIGYTTKARTISSLLLGIYNKQKLIFVGKVGTGFDAKTYEILQQEFEKLKSNNPIMEIPERNVQWLKPELVCEVKYQEFTSSGRLREPVFLRLRPDKPAQGCILELGGNPQGQVRG